MILEPERALESTVKPALDVLTDHQVSNDQIPVVLTRPELTSKPNLLWRKYQILFHEFRKLPAFWHPSLLR
jgi:hypothetical protein